MRKSNTKEFIIKANLIHNNKYDYSLVEYINNKTKVKIICPKHDVFFQIPNNHLSGNGCPKCSKSKFLTTKEFIIKANLIHNNKYDYSLVEYTDTYTKVKIICPKHNIFFQAPTNHLSGNGCPKCSGKLRMTTKEFITKANLIHNNKYDYKLTEYINNKTKVKIICPKHDVFFQTPTNHLSNKGCPICKSSKGEEKIYHYLTENDIKFEREKKFKDLGNKRFDFYLPNLNTIIEFDGEQHFKAKFGEEEFIRTKVNDEIKNHFCLKNDIRLIRISYIKFDDIENILDNYLK